MHSPTVSKPFYTHGFILLGARSRPATAWALSMNQELPVVQELVGMPPMKPILK